MKIRMPTKLGFKNPKYVVAMEVTNTDKGGYWEDQGYNWFSGPVALFELIAATNGVDVAGPSPTIRITASVSLAPSQCTCLP